MQHWVCDFPKCGVCLFTHFSLSSTTVALESRRPKRTNNQIIPFCDGTPVANWEFRANSLRSLFGARTGWRRWAERASYSLEKGARERASILLAATVNAGIQTPDWVRRFFPDSSDASARRGLPKQTRTHVQAKPNRREDRCIFKRTLRCKWCYYKLKSWK